jgi:hypothetical protein
MPRLGEENLFREAIVAVLLAVQCSDWDWLVKVGGLGLKIQIKEDYEAIVDPGKRHG